MERGWYCYVCNGWFTDTTTLEDVWTGHRVSVHCIKKDDKIFNLCHRCMKMFCLCSYVIQDYNHYCPVNEMIEEKENMEE